MEVRSVINVDEAIGKTVGRRRPPTKLAGLQETLNQAFASQGHYLCPRGVFRFKTHAEANLWSQQMLRPRKVT